MLFTYVLWSKTHHFLAKLLKFGLHDRLGVSGVGSWMLGDYLPIHQVPRQGLDDSERIADQRDSVYIEVVIGPFQSTF